MDCLPKTLTSLLKIVNEQYTDFSWTSTEQNGRMKISLLWTNGDKSTKRKSNASRKRDRKRLKQFVEKKNSENKTSESEDESFIESDTESDIPSEPTDALMDVIDSVPCSASLTVNTNKGKQSSEENNQLRTESVKHVNGNLNAAGKICISEHSNTQNMLTKSHDVVNTENISNTEEKSKSRQTPVLDKIVIKTSLSMCSATLLTLIPMINLIMSYSLGKEEDIHYFGPGTKRYTYALHNIENDFDDVRKTKYMNSDIASAIEKMEIVARRKIETWLN